MAYNDNTAIRNLVYTSMFTVSLAMFSAHYSVDKNRNGEQPAEPKKPNIEAIILKEENRRISPQKILIRPKKVELYRRNLYDIKSGLRRF